MWKKSNVCMAEADSGEGGGAGGGGFAYAAAASIGSSEVRSTAIPERYQVRTEGGSLDVEASSLRLSEAYNNLERRLGAGDMRPSSADEYQIAMPGELTELLNPKEDQVLGAFMKEAHAAGYTQKQMDLVMGKYFELAPQLATGSMQLSADDCVAELKTEWKTDEQYNAEVKKAFRAAQAYGDKDAEAIIAKCGNDPAVIRLFARIGAHIGEDTSLNPGGTLPAGRSVQSLMNSEAYSNPKHHDHARVSAQVQRHFARQAKEI